MAKIFADIFGGSSNTASGSRRSRELRAPEGYGGAVSSSTPAYTLPRLQQLWERLRRFGDTDLVQGGGDAVVETVRQITEALIWGEQHDTNFFDFFCEKSILSEFIRVLGHRRAPKKVKVQLLQTLSMLVQNIRCQTSLYYLLSNNYVNKLIEMPLDFNDEEILCYYITLLKSLALRLDGDTIHFFFIKSPVWNFPLYIESTKFFSHPDQMIRAAVRTITLQVYRIEDPTMRAFVKRHAAESYFTELAQHLRELWWRLDDAISGAPSVNEIERLQLENELQQDFLMYLADMLDLGVDDLNEVLADSLLNGAVLPMLLSSIAHHGNPSEPSVESPSHRMLTLNAALFLLRQVLETIRSRVILEPLVSALLLPSLDPALAYSLPHTDEHALCTDGLVSNAFREHFLKCLRSNFDVVFLFAAASVHSCIQNRSIFSEEFLIRARIIPGRQRRSSVSLKSLAAWAKSSSGKAEENVLDNEAWEVLLLLLHGLQRFTHWQMNTFEVFCRIALDVFVDPQVGSQCQAAILQALHAALRASAQGVRHQMHEALARSEDFGLDIFDEEWQMHASQRCRISEACSDPRWLLWSQDPTRFDVAIDKQLVLRQTLRNFLLLRRLLEDVVHSDKATGDVCQQPCMPPPLVFGEDSVEAEVSQGSSVMYSMSDRIVCHIIREGVKLTRYLILRDFKLLLVAPDLSNPGYAFVKTAWPIWQVSCFIDRSDPRTLLLGLHSSTPHGPPPGEADPSQQCPQDNRRPGTYFTITLGFEDVERCHWADKHLQLRRQEVRSGLAQQALQFVERYCSQPLLGQDAMTATTPGFAD